MNGYLYATELKKRLAELEYIKEHENEDGAKNYLDDDEKIELEELQSLDLDYIDEHEVLISEGEFVDYCMNMLEDIGYISKDLPVFIEIDWKQTAENLKADYRSIEYQGETYWYRY